MIAYYYSKKLEQQLKRGDLIYMWVSHFAGEYELDDRPEDELVDVFKLIMVLTQPPKVDLHM